MSLDIALQDAISGLRAAQAHIQVISGNIANAQTPGYSRQTVSEQSQVTPSGGGGVVTGLIERASDRILNASLLAQTTTAGGAAARDGYLQRLQGLFGTVGDGNTLNDALGKFMGAMQAVATTPEDAVAQGNAVFAGQALARKLNDLSAQVQSLRHDIDGDLGAAVTTLNQSLGEIARFNGQIGHLKALGQPTASLEDQRDLALKQAAGLIDLQSFTRADGTMVVMTASGRTLVSSAAQAVDYVPVGNVTATTPLSPVTINGADVTGELTGGKIGALLKLRDTDMPALTAELNQFTNNLFDLTTTPGLDTSDSGLGATDDSHHFFAAVDTAGGTDNAATIQVHPALLANPDLLHTGAGGPDPAIAQTLSANLSNATAFAAAGNFPGTVTTTLTDYAAQMLGYTANAAAAAQADSTFQASLQSEIESRVAAVSGVNIDEELSNLTVYQNAYGASARVVTVVQTMFDTLLRM